MVTGILGGEALPHTDMWSKTKCKGGQFMMHLWKINMELNFMKVWFEMIFLFKHVIFRNQPLIFEGCIRSEKFGCQLSVSLGGWKRFRNQPDVSPFFSMSEMWHTQIQPSYTTGNLRVPCQYLQMMLCVFCFLCIPGGFQKRNPKRIHKRRFFHPSYHWGSKG